MSLLDIFKAGVPCPFPIYVKEEERLVKLGLDLKEDGKICLEIKVAPSVNWDFQMESLDEYFDIKVRFDADGFHMLVESEETDWHGEYIICGTTHLANTNNVERLSFPPDAKMVSDEHVGPLDDCPMMATYTDGTEVTHCAENWDAYKVVFDIDAWRAQLAEKWLNRFVGYAAPLCGGPLPGDLYTDIARRAMGECMGGDLMTLYVEA